MLHGHTSYGGICSGASRNHLKFEFGAVITPLGGASFARHGVHDVHRAHYLNLSAAIQDVSGQTLTVYRQRGVPFKRGIDPGLSDHVAFGNAGIPYGWLFTGADAIKTAEEVAVWGGKAGMPMDPCYHLTCDNLGNINTVALALNADAIAYAALHFAMNRLPR